MFRYCSDKDILLPGPKINVIMITFLIAHLPLFHRALPLQIFPALLPSYSVQGVNEEAAAKPR